MMKYSRPRLRHVIGCKIRVSVSGFSSPVQTGRPLWRHRAQVPLNSWWPRTCGRSLSHCRTSLENKTCRRRGLRWSWWTQAAPLLKLILTWSWTAASHWPRAPSWRCDWAEATHGLALSWVQTDCSTWDWHLSHIHIKHHLSDLWPVNTITVFVMRTDGWSRGIKEGSEWKEEVVQGVSFTLLLKPWRLRWVNRKW